MSIFKRKSNIEVVRSDRSEFTPQSLDQEDRSVEVVFSTGAKRSMWFRGQDISESLEISKTAIRTERLNNGAAVLDSHWSYSIDEVLGSVVPDSFRIEDGNAVCRIKFSESERGMRAFQAVSEGTLRFVSVGYIVHRYDVDEEENHYQATDWEPCEISLVPVPADAGATIRKQSPITNDPEIIMKGRSEMSKNQPEETMQATEEAEPQAVEQRDSSADIVDICMLAGLGIQEAQGYIRSGKTVDEVKADVLARKEAEMPEVRAQEAPETQDVEEFKTPNRRSIYDKLNGEANNG